MLADMKAFKRWVQEASMEELKARKEKVDANLFRLSGDNLSDAKRYLAMIEEEITIRNSIKK